MTFKATSSVSTERFEVIPDGYEKVIRCKDCKYFERGNIENVKTSEIEAMIICSDMCIMWNGKTFEDEFCSLAKRKEVDEC